MQELKIKNYNGIKVIDSRDVATMVERNHNELLKTIRNYIAYLREGDFAQSDFFIESRYLNAQSRETPCYLITKLGCDMIANKMTGKKGVLFTAAYVTAFNEMKETIQNMAMIPPHPLPPFGEIARFSKSMDTVLMAQGSPGWKRAEAFYLVCKQAGIYLPDNFVEPHSEQLLLFGDNNSQIVLK